ncbi:MAG: Hsp20 family protein, partial [Bacteroidota bacterium]
MIWKDSEENELVESIKKNANLNLLGFDDFFSRLVNIKNTINYPPYNIEKIGENEWCIMLALAGFSQEDLDISLEGMQLVVKGTRPKEDEKKEYIYRGIANRSFQRSFFLADSIEISNANLE